MASAHPGCRACAVVRSEEAAGCGAGLGRSLKILKAETKDLREDGTEEPEQEYTASEAKALPSAQSATTTSNGAKSEDDKVAELQRQLDELKQQKNAG